MLFGCGENKLIIEEMHDGILERVWLLGNLNLSSDDLMLTGRIFILENEP